MDYPLENLDPEKFQEFCQALILTVYPRSRAFPVGQPDGGRDAWVNLRLDPRDSIVFQVKFVRKPLAETAPHEWIKSIAQGEAIKAKRLIHAGATRYILITNVPGTAHPGSGSIDIVDDILTNELGIPTECWWRDDINRRLDNAYNLKWAYPELMTGPDLIRSIIESGLGEDKERRSNAIRAFVSAQYSQDQEVRFKQVELQNRLLDLFVDVPIQFNHSHSGDRRQREYMEHAFRRRMLRVSQRISPTARSYDPHPPFQPSVGAASLFLASEAQNILSNLVLEGAPGQGKSTITQYVCQVYRMRLLGEKHELDSIPAYHQQNAARLPFKVDLRDFATWLLKKDPFDPEIGKTPAHWEKSLEAFLVAHIRYFSGGATFSVSDLHAVAKVSSILLVFDGLDEVADIKRRREIVDELKKGIDRLRAIAVSLQAIVTTRPAAFANSPGLPDDSFPYFSLRSLERQDVESYAEKWLKARRIYNREAAEVKSILKEKIDQPHLRELARNPMQLTILLSLIHSRGTSLPDKRTALYDSYMELFFSRESTKNEVVRDHRELLIDIHRYLAWTLHSEAELGTERDKISEERLRRVLLDYLQSEGHDEGIFDQLFTTMIERVVAIVSRVQGIYEFEVQPLREYFAARHLYVTAPYSPTGDERRGTMPDRFDAIARNFYWLNVTRFFAGCLDKGELPALVDRLQVLTGELGYRYTSYPRILAAMLLSDWVFTQQPRHLKQVVELVLDPKGMRYLCASATEQREDLLTLPDRCGRRELVEKCFDLLDLPHQKHVYSRGITRLIEANGIGSETLTLWLTRAMRAERDKKAQWLLYGRDIGCLSQLHLPELDVLMSDDEVNGDRLSILFSAKRFDYLRASERRFHAIVEAILDGLTTGLHQLRGLSTLESLAIGLDLFRYARAIGDERLPVAHAFSREEEHYDLDIQDMPEEENFSDTPKVRSLISGIKEQVNHPGRVWTTHLAPWDAVVEGARFQWGERRILIELALLAAGIRSTTETGDNAADLFNSSSSLCQRVRYARLRSGNRSWWQHQLTAASTAEQKVLALLTLLTWASGRTLSSLAPDMEGVLESIKDSWLSFMKSLTRIQEATQIWDNKMTFLSATSLPKRMSAALAAALYPRATPWSREELYSRFVRKYDGDDYWILRISQEHVLSHVGSSGKMSNSDLALISRAYQAGVALPAHSLRDRGTLAWLSPELAEKITSEPEKYPDHLVFVAERIFKDEVTRKVTPVGDVARRDRWFENSRARA